jgi:hypothetical protein
MQQLIRDLCSFADRRRGQRVTNPLLPAVYMFHCTWQYPPREADWALSVPYNTYQTLGRRRYRVELRTEYAPGEMLVAHRDKRGCSDRIS